MQFVYWRNEKKDVLLHVLLCEYTEKYTEYASGKICFNAQTYAIMQAKP